MSSTLESSAFMGKNYSDNWHSIKNTKDLTMKQMFDISEKVVFEQDESDEEVISLLDTPWKDEREPAIKLCMGRQIDAVQKFTRIQNFGQN